MNPAKRSNPYGITGINHISFTVSNLERSIIFYRDILSMNLTSIGERRKEFAEKVTGIPEAHLKTAYLEGWGYTLELIQYLSPPGKKVDIRTCDVGSTHLCFNVVDIYYMLRRLRKEEISFQADPLKIPAGPNRGGFTVYFKDPDGITLEFIQPPVKQNKREKTLKPL